MSRQDTYSEEDPFELARRGQLSEAYECAESGRSGQQEDHRSAEQKINDWIQRGRDQDTYGNDYR